MTEPNAYKPGDTVRASAQVTSLGVFANPDTFTLAVKFPDGSTVSPTVVNDATGEYHADFLIPSGLVLPTGLKRGVGWYRWAAVGSSPPEGCGVAEVRFYVDALAF